MSVIIIPTQQMGQMPALRLDLESGCSLSNVPFKTLCLISFSCDKVSVTEHISDVGYPSICCEYVLFL